MEALAGSRERPEVQKFGREDKLSAVQRNPERFIGGRDRLKRELETFKRWRPVLQSSLNIILIKIFRFVPEWREKHRHLGWDWEFDPVFFP